MTTCESKPARRLMWGLLVGLWMFGGAALSHGIAALISAL